MPKIDTLDHRLSEEMGNDWRLESLRQLDREAEALRKRTEKKPMSLVSFLIWLAIAVVILLSLCIEKAQALEASWYSEAALKRDGQWDITHGRMANGEIFSDDQYIGASRDFPLGTVVLVTAGEHSTVVVIKDRINKRFKGVRIDLSPRAFSELAPLSQGIIQGVKVEIL